MEMIRRLLGWILAMCGAFVLLSLTLIVLIGVVRSTPSATPLVAYGVGALIFGVCPLFLGWVLVRRKPPAEISTPVKITSLVPEHLPPAEPPTVAAPAGLVIDVLLQQSDLTHLQYWIFRKNWFIRIFFVGFVIAVIAVILQWESLHWESFRQAGWKSLLYPAALVGLVAMPWLSARLSFLKYAVTGSTRFTFSSTGFRVSTTGLTVDSSWASVRLCWETPRAFVFFVRPPSRLLYRPEPVDATVIPKRCFQHPDDEARLRAVLAQALGQRAVLLSPG